VDIAIVLLGDYQKEFCKACGQLYQAQRFLFRANEFNTVFIIIISLVDSKDLKSKYESLLLIDIKFILIISEIFISSEFLAIVYAYFIYLISSTL